MRVHFVRIRVGRLGLDLTENYSSWEEAKLLTVVNLANKAFCRQGSWWGGSGSWLRRAGEVLLRFFCA